MLECKSDWMRMTVLILSLVSWGMLSNYVLSLSLNCLTCSIDLSFWVGSLKGPTR